MGRGMGGRVNLGMEGQGSALRTGGGPKHKCECNE